MGKNDSLIELLEEYKAAVFLWRTGHEDFEDGSSIRTFINRKTPAVKKLVWRAGCFKFMNVAPPPAVGGMAFNRLDPFECMYQPPYGVDMTGTIRDMIDQCVGIIQAGELPPEPPPEIVRKIEESQKISDKTVFIVHGRDEETKQTVARFLEKLGLKVVILHERGNSGLTIIEKLAKHSVVAYAVVLLTADDVGAMKTAEQTLHNRARQNVVFELGYFMAKLGRENVCVIQRGDIELPSDSDGILYIPYDPSEGWKLLLARELKDAGLDVDLNAAIQS